jgi:hypothetical protein
MANHDCITASATPPPKASPYAVLAPFSGLEADVHNLESMAFLAITAFEHMIDSVPVPATPEEGSALWAAIHLHELIRQFQDAYTAALTEGAKAAEGDRVRL